MEGQLMSRDTENIPRYEEYPAETEPTPTECMERCDHFGACARIYELFGYDTTYRGWMDAMSSYLHCDECDEWDGKPW